MSIDPRSTVRPMIDEPAPAQPEHVSAELATPSIDAASTSPGAPDRDPFAAIHPYPGEAVPWPPGPDQRGLASPYPPGGEDPQPDEARREERFYLKLLLAMVLVIVVGGFALSILALVLGFGAGS